jgi:hypothetical protein
MYHRALIALSEERRKNQALERKMEDMQLEIAALERRLETRNAGSVNGTGVDPIATPRRGWSLLNMIREASNVGTSGALPPPAQGDYDRRNSNNGSAPLDDEDDFEDMNEVVLQLAQTKVCLAQVEGKLAESRRDLSRMRELNNALETRIISITEERDKSWQDVSTSLLVPLFPGIVALCGTKDISVEHKN